jgi:hypothetical protein
MNRREFLGVTTVAGMELLGGGCASHATDRTAPSLEPNATATARIVHSIDPAKIPPVQLSSSLMLRPRRSPPLLRIKAGNSASLWSNTHLEFTSALAIPETAAKENDIVQKCEAGF